MCVCICAYIYMYIYMHKVPTLGKLYHAKASLVSSRGGGNLKPK